LGTLEIFSKVVGFWQDMVDLNLSSAFLVEWWIFLEEEEFPYVVHFRRDGVFLGG